MGLNFLPKYICSKHQHTGNITFMVSLQNYKNLYFAVLHQNKGKKNKGDLIDNLVKSETSFFLSF